MRSRVGLVPAFSGTTETDLPDGGERRQATHARLVVLVHRLNCGLRRFGAGRGAKMGRNMRTLHGKRVRLGDLLDAGLLNDGEQLTITMGSRTASATVVAPGRLRVATGQDFQTPSPAASAVLGGGSIDGWVYWRTSSGRTLDALRQHLLDEVAAAPDPAEEAVSDPGTLTAPGRAWLKDVRDSALAGNPTTISLRDLLAYWSLERRDSVETNHVVEALSERRLQAVPSIFSAALDDTVVLSLIGSPPTTSGQGASSDDRPPTEGVGLGLTLATLLDPDRPLCSVQPQDSLATAMTLMRLNGYSQLPIMNGRTLKGAVTWESIAQVLRMDADAQVKDASVHAESHPADRHLLEVIDAIALAGFVIVLGVSGPTGIVTHSDVADAFVKMATPFALIGDLDRRLRAVLDEAVEWEFLKDVVDASDSRGLKSIDQLTFGDYVVAFRSERIWDQLSWWIDRSAFCKRLDELRAIRNNVTHFNPDPPSAEAIHKLRLMNRLITELTVITGPPS